MLGKERRSRVLGIYSLIWSLPTLLSRKSRVRIDPCSCFLAVYRSWKEEGASQIKGRERLDAPC